VQLLEAEVERVEREELEFLPRNKAMLQLAKWMYLESREPDQCLQMCHAVIDNITQKRASPEEGRTADEERALDSLEMGVLSQLASTTAHATDDVSQARQCCESALAILSKTLSRAPTEEDFPDEVRPAPPSRPPWPPLASTLVVPQPRNVGA
jgi:hypothetical protein